MLVYPRGATFELLGDLGGLFRIAPPDRAAQPVGGRVRAPHRFVDVLVWHDGQGRTELLFIDQPYAVRDFADDGRRVEVTLVAETLPARDDFGPMFLRVFHQLGDPFELGLVIQRPKLGSRIEAVTDLHALRDFAQRLEHARIHFLVN